MTAAGGSWRHTKALQQLLVGVALIGPILPACIPVPALAARGGGDSGCAIARHVVRLGGKDLAGNPSPVKARIHEGARITVIARFGQRRLTIPVAKDRSVLSKLCQDRDGYRVLATFRAEQLGRTLVHVETDDCPPCAQLGFEARIRVVQPS
jgi:hypothetical protein